jgi:hypothetical protein
MLLRLFGRYLHNILISLDQLLNTLLFGSVDETISSRVGKNYKGSWAEKAIDFVFYRGHCQDSIEWDEGIDALMKQEKKD